MISSPLQSINRVFPEYIIVTEAKEKIWICVGIPLASGIYIYSKVKKKKKKTDDIALFWTTKQ